MWSVNFFIDRKVLVIILIILRDNFRYRKVFCKVCFFILVEVKLICCLFCICRGYLFLCCILLEVLMINSIDYLKVFSVMLIDVEGYFVCMWLKKVCEMNL